MLPTFNLKKLHSPYPIRRNPSAILMVEPRQVGKMPAMTPTVRAAASCSMMVETEMVNTGKNWEINILRIQSHHHLFKTEPFP